MSPSESPSNPAPEAEDAAELSETEARWVEAFYRPLAAPEQAALLKDPQAAQRLRVLAAWSQSKAQQQWTEGRAPAQAQLAAWLMDTPLQRPAPQGKRVDRQPALRHGLFAVWQWLQAQAQRHTGPLLSALAVQGVALLWLVVQGPGPVRLPHEASTESNWRGAAVDCAPWRVQWRTDLSLAAQERALLQLQLQIRSGPDDSGHYTLAGPGSVESLQAALAPLTTHFEPNPMCAAPRVKPQSGSR